LAGALGAGLLLAGGLAGCAQEPDAGEADALTDFRDRAVAASTTPWAARYALEKSDGGEAEVSIARAPGSLRLDIDVDGTVSTFIATEDGTVACTQRGTGDPSCLTAAGPGGTPPPALDPGLREVVADGLQRLGEGFGSVEVLGEQPGVDADALCARASGNDVPAGVYCLLPDGVPASTNFTSGSLKLIKRLDPPTDGSFTPPATPRPAR
jgi:hypothetical protein